MPIRKILAEWARQLRAITGNVQVVLSTEMMYAAQNLDFQKLRACRGKQAAYEYICSFVTHLGDDRYYLPDVLRISGELLRVAQAAQLGAASLVKTSAGWDTSSRH